MCFQCTSMPLRSMAIAKPIPISKSQKRGCVRTQADTASFLAFLFLVSVNVFVKREAVYENYLGKNNYRNPYKYFIQRKGFFRLYGYLCHLHIVVLLVCIFLFIFLFGISIEEREGQGAVSKEVCTELSKFYLFLFYLY